MKPPITIPNMGESNYKGKLVFVDLKTKVESSSVPRFDFTYYQDRQEYKLPSQTNLAGKIVDFNWQRAYKDEEKWIQKGKPIRYEATIEYSHTDESGQVHDFTWLLRIPSTYPGRALVNNLLTAYLDPEQREVNISVYTKQIGKDEWVGNTYARWRAVNEAIPGRVPFENIPKPDNRLPNETRKQPVDRWMCQLINEARREKAQQTGGLTKDQQDFVSTPPAMPPMTPPQVTPAVTPPNMTPPATQQVTPNPFETTANPTPSDNDGLNDDLPF